ncbi:MAG: HK97-gp10 family putative phage morphogenesis protein [Oscillospiraceae bacterium]
MKSINIDELTNELVGIIKGNIENIEGSVDNTLDQYLTIGLEELKSNTPRSPFANKKHLQDSWVSERDVFKIGKEKNAVFHNTEGWRMHFLEFGTIYQRPQPFVVRSYDTFSVKFYRDLIDNINKNI